MWRIKISTVTKFLDRYPYRHNEIFFFLDGGG